MYKRQGFKLDFLLILDGFWEGLGGQVGQKIQQKSFKNRLKWVLGAPEPPPGQLSFNLEALDRFLVIFGSPLRPPKQPKTNPWPKKWSQGPQRPFFDQF